MRDVFEPRNEPAKSIYLAFQVEAAKRHGRALDEWMEAERTAVHQECRRQAESRDLNVPTIEEVAAAERYARGSIDYGATWAYQLVRMMTPAAGASTR
jgi:hypothetical protein